jgi:hypothetical protein
VLYLLLLATLSAAPVDTAPRDPCARDARGPNAVHAFVAMPAIATRDTVVTVAMCVVLPRTSGKKIGSYHALLHFDSTSTGVIRVVSPAGAMHAENATKAGVLDFAAVNPQGFVESAIASVVLRIKNPGSRPAVRLQLRELNATDGTNLMSQLAAPSE